MGHPPNNDVISDVETVDGGGMALSGMGVWVHYSLTRVLPTCLQIIVMKD